MLNVKRSVIIITLFSIILGITGCSRKLPIELTNELEKISGTNTDGTKFNLNVVPIIDSKTGQAKYFRHEEDILLGPINNIHPASEIIDVSTVSVVRVSGIEVKGTEYKSCNYITIDSQKVETIERSLICQGNGFREAELSAPDKVSELPIIPKDFAGRLAKSGEIDNIGFLVVTDVITGETKLLKHENYVSLPVILPLKIDALLSSNSWSTITYKLNPCCTCTTTSGGDNGCSCRKWLPAC